MLLGVLIASLLFFVLAAALLRIPQRCRETLRQAKDAVRILGDARLNDFEREQAMRRTALRHFAASLGILARGLAACAAAMLPVAAAHYAGLAPFPEMIDFLSRWEVLAAASLLAVAIWALASRLR